MSNAKLKEQIEAAKIALVHSAELATPLDPPQQSAQVAEVKNLNNDDDSPRLVDTATFAEADSSRHLNQNEMPQSDFEMLEVRLQDLQTQIKNQQRDLHTLLQKLRDITAKSKTQAEPKKSKGRVKWVIGMLLAGSSLAAIVFTLGSNNLISAIYTGIGKALALIDTLFNTL